MLKFGFSDMRCSKESCIFKKKYGSVKDLTHLGLIFVELLTKNPNIFRLSITAKCRPINSYFFQKFKCSIFSYLKPYVFPSGNLKIYEYFIFPYKVWANVEYTQHGVMVYT